MCLMTIYVIELHTKKPCVGRLGGHDPFCPFWIRQWYVSGIVCCYLVVATLHLR